MSISTELHALITSLTAVTALIGTSPMRLYPQNYGQNPVYPLITYHVVDGMDTYAHSGFSGLVNTRIQLTLRSRVYLQNETLKRAVQDGLRAYVGGTIDRIFCQDMGTDYVELTQVHLWHLDLLIAHREI